MSNTNLYNQYIKNTSSEREVDEYLKENQITVHGGGPAPVLKFSDLNLPPRVTQLFARENYTKPTCIQATAWPTVLQGRDMVAIAQTGSGKTLGYLLPAILSISQMYERTGNPLIVVLAPTRELAQQIHQVAKKFEERYLRTCCVFGGAPKGPQIRDCRRGIEICIATPGRLIDLLNMNVISMNDCSYLILDEADRMLDMGFEPQVREIIKKITGSKRQTLMFSATWPRQVQQLAGEFLKNYVQVTVGSDTHTLTANHSIQQIISVCEEHEKADKLFNLLCEIYKQEKHKTIIFAETKRKVDELTDMLKKEQFDVVGIHGDKDQRSRDYILRSFTKGQYQCMIATDVAGRGLDVDDIKYVINYDFPNNSEDYVHRIGRTGRRGQTGTAYTFFTKKNSRNANDLIAVLKEANQEVPKELEAFQRYGGGKMGGGYQRYNRYGSGGGGSNRYTPYGNRSNHFNKENNYNKGGSRASYGGSSYGGSSNGYRSNDK